MLGGRRAAWYTPTMLRFGMLALVLGLSFLPGEAPASSAAQASPIVVLFASDQPSYQVGTPATFTIAVDNPGPAPATLTFPSAQRYDIVVLSGDAEVWRWSADRAFVTLFGERSFDPGLTLLGRESWDWRDSSGAPLPPGTYRVVGIVASSPRQSGNVLEITLNAP